MEIWKDIPEYEGLYQASDTGFIRTKEGKTTYTEKHGKRNWKSRVLKYKCNTNPQKHGLKVDLWKNGKPKTFLIHRLIATTFLGDNINTNLTVNHKNGNRTDNSVKNLEWLTLKDNIIHGFDNEFFGSCKKVKVKNLDTGECSEFRSMSKASQFLGMNTGYLSNKIKRIESEVNNEN